jgi:hypothetical protein
MPDIFLSNMIFCQKEGYSMKRKLWPYLFIAAAYMTGCNSDVSTSDDTYNEMISKYTLLTVSELWTALGNSNEDYDGTYILLKGVLLSVGTNSVTLIDSDTKKSVKCSFDTSIDLTTLSEVLANDTGSEEDIVTVGGVSHYYTDTSSYPYLEDCDYFYVNDDA